MGLKGAKALDVVKIAAEGAKVGHADLEQTTNALTAAVASGIPGIQNMSQAMGVLNGIVGAGDMKMQDLNEALGTGLLTVVKGYGLSITDVGAALATFGDNNIRGADAATMLRMAVQAMAVPAKEGKSTLDKLGLSTTQLRDDMQKGGLNLALQDLAKHLTDSGVKANQVGGILTEAFGKKAGPGLAVLEGQMTRFETKLTDVKDSGNKFGSDWQAWTKSNQGQIDQLTARTEAFGVEVGTKLLPVLNATVGFLNHNSTAVLTFIGALAGVKLAIGAVAAAQDLWAAGTVAAGAAVSALETLYVGAMYAMEGAAGPVVAALVGITAVVGIATKGFGLFGGSAKQQIKPVQALTDAITADGQAIGKLTEAQVNKTLSDKGAYTAGLKLGVSQATVLQATLGNAGAMKIVKDAVDKANAAYKEGTSTVATYGSATKAGSAATKVATQAEKDNKTAADTLGTSTGVLTGQLTASARQARDQASALAGTTAAALAATKAIQAVRAAVEGLESKAITVTTYANTVLGPVGSTGYNSATRDSHHAGGTDYWSGGPTSVNEQGNEVINLPKGTQIHTASQSKTLGNGVTIINHITAGMGTDGHAVGRQIIAAIEKYVGTGGTLKIARGVR